MRAWAGEVYGLPPHRVIGSVGETEFRNESGGTPELVKSPTVQVMNDGPQKPSSIHRHVGQRPIMAAGNTDGDLAMLQWTAASPYRTLELVVHHTDGVQGTRRRVAAAASERDWKSTYSRSAWTACWVKALAVCCRYSKVRMGV